MFTNQNRTGAKPSQVTKTGIISLALALCALLGITTKVWVPRIVPVAVESSLAGRPAGVRPLLIAASVPYNGPAVASDGAVYNGAFDPITGGGHNGSSWLDIIEERQIPYSQTFLENTTLPSGTLRVIRPGVTGLKRFYKRAYFAKGWETRFVTLSTEVVTRPVEEIVEVGTCESAAGSPLRYGDVTSDKQVVTTPDGVRLPYQSSLEVTATAYTTERQANTLTYTETVARVGAIAVDPEVIPLGSTLYICSADDTWIYGVAVAEDIGGAIKGAKIDLFFNTYDECIQFGCRPATVYVLKRA